MAGRECYHCKQWVENGTAHDCWTTTEAALTAELSEDLREAWERLRETAVEFGEQRIYASHSSIMFSRKVCYFFVRPKKKYLELYVFLPRLVTAPQIVRADQSSRTKVGHLIKITHRDQVEAPVTDWLLEAYRLQDAPPAVAKPAKKAAIGLTSRKKAATGIAAKRKAAKKKIARKTPTQKAPASNARRHRPTAR